MFSLDILKIIFSYTHKKDISPCLRELINSIVGHTSYYVKFIGPVRGQLDYTPAREQFYMVNRLDYQGVSINRIKTTYVTFDKHKNKLWSSPDGDNPTHYFPTNDPDFVRWWDNKITASMPESIENDPSVTIYIAEDSNLNVYRGKILEYNAITREMFINREYIDSDVTSVMKNRNIEKLKIKGLYWEYDLKMQNGEPQRVLESSRYTLSPYDHNEYCRNRHTFFGNFKQFIQNGGLRNLKTLSISIVIRDRFFINPDPLHEFIEILSRNCPKLKKVKVRISHVSSRIYYLLPDITGANLTINVGDENGNNIPEEIENSIRDLNIEDLTYLELCALYGSNRYNTQYENIFDDIFARLRERVNPNLHTFILSDTCAHPNIRINYDQLAEFAKSCPNVRKFKDQAGKFALSGLNIMDTYQVIDIWRELEYLDITMSPVIEANNNLARSISNLRELETLKVNAGYRFLGMDRLMKLEDLDREEEAFNDPDHGEALAPILPNMHTLMTLHIGDYFSVEEVEKIIESIRESDNICELLVSLPLVPLWDTGANFLTNIPRNVKKLTLKYWNNTRFMHTDPYSARGGIKAIVELLERGTLNILEVHLHSSRARYDGFREACAPYNEVADIFWNNSEIL